VSNFKKQEEVKLKALGRHLLIEFFNCDRKLLNDVLFVEKVLTKSAELAGATIVKTFFHTFNPHGVSGVVVIAESHLTIHTWPEYGYAAVDVFTCGDDVDPYVSYQYLKEKLKAKGVHIMEVKRGLFENIRNAITKKVGDGILAGEK
jgi:S-adenosylmethionine decarboxylase